MSTNARRARGSADAGRGEPLHIEDEDMTVGEVFTRIRGQAGEQHFPEPTSFNTYGTDDDFQELMDNDGYDY